ncbi:MAG: HtrA protease/chaperone protein [Myxococcaceae bacterium]|nr:HtrA protease/chaperone protein [Myxococcaceae bacterium]
MQNSHSRTRRAPIALGLALLAPLPVSIVAAHAWAAPPSSAEQGPIATANQLGVAFSHIAEQVSPSVVSIQVEVKGQPLGGGMGGLFGLPFGRPQQEPGTQKGSGSGMVLTPDGAILTNNHVVEHASRIQVTLQDGRHFPGKVLGVDPATDLAVVKIDAKGLTPIRFADSDAAKVGQWVVAIGSPFGLDYTVTAGVLSAKGRGSLGANEIEDYLQTDASINPGNSGGPLVNLQGEVLGVNTMIIGSSGIGFAIPSNLSRKVGLELLQKGDVSRAWIGVSYQELTPELASSFGVQRTRGALINEVVPAGPASKAGLRGGDIVLDIQGREVKEGKDLLRAILLYPVGEKLTVTVLRDGKPQKLSVVTAERPDHREANAGNGIGRQRGEKRNVNSSGVELAQVTPEIARRLGYSGPGGVVVADVAPGSPAEQADLSRGDVIEEVNRKPATGEKQVLEAIAKGRALLKVVRQGNARYVVVGD